MHVDFHPALTAPRPTMNFGNQGVLIHKEGPVHLTAFVDELVRSDNFRILAVYPDRTLQLTDV
ncbi:hypothetical protein STENM223S_07164 [Streptomyces tendae]